MGFSSVMIDGSHLPYEENVALTKQVVDYAHQFDVTVEGELGVLAGVEDEVSSEVAHYTRPEEVVDFVTKTGVDSLAISIGTSHGANKFKPEQWQGGLHRRRNGAFACKQRPAGAVLCALDKKRSPSQMHGKGLSPRSQICRCVRQHLLRGRAYLSNENQVL